jgi:hypothetical protein
VGDAIGGDAAVGEFPHLLLAASAIAARLAIGCRLHRILSVAGLAHSECLPLGRVPAFLHLHLRGALDLEPTHRRRVSGQRPLFPQPSGFEGRGGPCFPIRPPGKAGPMELSLLLIVIGIALAILVNYALGIVCILIGLVLLVWPRLRASRGTRI